MTTRGVRAALFSMLAILVPMATTAAVPSYDRLVVFGDSLSDTGNAGRFSNGPVWVEYLAREIGTVLYPARFGGTNFAVGGARTHDGEFSLRGQVDLFLAMRQDLDPRTLFVVYGGANDLRTAAYAEDRQAIVDGAIDTLRGILDDLVAAGATQFLVPNLPDIGRTPEARSHGPDWMREARALTQAFNARLDEVLRELEAQQSLRIHRLDVFGLLERAVADPVRYGMRDMINPCPGAATTNDCEGYAFWDNMHPTTAGHARLAEAAIAVLSDAAVAR